MRVLLFGGGRFGILDLPSMCQTAVLREWLALRSDLRGMPAHGRIGCACTSFCAPLSPGLTAYPATVVRWCGFLASGKEGEFASSSSLRRLVGANRVSGESIASLRRASFFPAGCWPARWVGREVGSRPLLLRGHRLCGFLARGNLGVRIWVPGEVENRAGR